MLPKKLEDNCIKTYLSSVNHYHKFLIQESHVTGEKRQTVEDLEARCRKSGIEIVTRQSFLNDPSESVRNLDRQVHIIAF